MKEEVRRALERADAMEAASALLQSDEEHQGGARSFLGAADLTQTNEERRGGRSVHGSVALVNVPAINGGAVHAESGFAFGSPRDPRLSHASESQPTGAGDGQGSGVAQGGKKVQRRMSWGRQKVPPSESGLRASAPEAQPAPGPAPTRRKGLVRSLSFGHEPRRPMEWGSAAG